LKETAIVGRPKHKKTNIKLILMGSDNANHIELVQDEVEWQTLFHVINCMD
jgi:hypothetical protein